MGFDLKKWINLILVDVYIIKKKTKLVFEKVFSKNIKNKPLSYEPYIKGTIKHKLDELGIKRGDTLFMHSGLSNLGFIKCSAKIVIDEIVDHLGPNGELIVPTYQLQHTQEAYYSKPIEFPVNKTINWLGAIPRYASSPKSSGQYIYQYSHNCVQFRGVGAGQSSALIDDGDPWSEGGVFGYLEKTKAKILLLGTDLDSVTYFHRIEKKLHEKFPIRIFKSKRIYIFGPIGSANSSRTIDCIIGKLSILRSMERFRDSIIKHKAMKETPIGQSSISVIELGLLEEVVLKKLQSKQTIYGKFL